MTMEAIVAKYASFISNEDCFQPIILGGRRNFDPPVFFHHLTLHTMNVFDARILKKIGLPQPEPCAVYYDEMGNEMLLPEGASIDPSWVYKPYVEDLINFLDEGCCIRKRKNGWCVESNSFFAVHADLESALVQFFLIADARKSMVSAT